MKKLLLLLIIMTQIIFIGLPQTVYAQTAHFARIKSNNVYLYRTAALNSNFSNLYFEIPNSYFIELVSDFNQTFYKAKYLDQIGYVKKSDVSPIKTTPKTAYAGGITFRVFASDGSNLRSEPTTLNGSSSVLTTVPTNTSSLQYYGKVAGEESILGRGNTWYYCKYTNGTSYYGYVYAGLCDMLSDIPQNTEVVSYMDNPYISESQSAHLKYLQTDENLNVILIVAVTIPALIIFYFLFVPIKLKAKKAVSPSPSKKQKGKTENYYDDKEL